MSSTTELRYRHSGERVYALVPTRDSAAPAPSAEDACDCSSCRERRASARQRTRDSTKINTTAELNESNRKKYGEQ